MLRMILEFMKTGLFSIGGGIATIPFLVIIGEKYGYYTYDELLTMFAVSESTPGAIGINMATFAGLKAYGFIGGVLATFAIVLPSLIIIILISKLMEKYRNNKYSENILGILKPLSIGFVGAAIIPILQSLFKEQELTWTIINLTIFGIVFFIREKYHKLHPGIIILSAFVLGAIIKQF